MKLTNVEKNVLLIALDHMEEHIVDLMKERELREVGFDVWKERLNSCKTIRTKFK